jgi:hypothetical protein
MFTSTLTMNGSIGGAAISASVQRTADGQIAQQPVLPAAKTGSLTTRTSDTAGTLTMEADHGILEADVIDIYWDGGGCYGAVVGVVSGTSVPFTGASGDVLPDEDSDVTASVEQDVDTDFEGDLLVMIGAKCAKVAQIGFYDGASLELHVDLAAGELWHWALDGPGTNPLAGKSITHVVMTHGDTSEAVLTLGILYDSTA